MSYKLENFLVAVGLIILLSLPVIGLYKENKIERFCLSKGYSSASWQPIGQSYCIKRVDQTDVVISVDSLK